MAVWSKFTPDIEELSCRTIVHPWTDNCLLAAGFTWFDTLIGSAGFFGTMLSVQLASMILKKKKVELKVFIPKFLRNCAFGATLSTSIVFFHCMLRRWLGKYIVPTTVFLPAFLGAFSIYLVPRSDRELFAITFANCFFELCLRLLESSKVLKWNSNTQTIVFMILSSAVSSTLSSARFNINHFWFFSPPKVTGPKSGEEEWDCFHKEDCKKHIRSLFLMYSSTGFVLQFLKLFLSNIKKPKVVLSSLIQPRTYKLAAFLGGYVAIYQAIRCFLYQREKKYSLNHDGVAGLLAGVAFRFQPTIPVLNSAIITIIQVLTEEGFRKKMLPNFNYLEVMFAFFCGFLFHYGILTKYSPKFVIFCMGAVSHGLTDRVSVTFEQIKKGLK